MAYFRCGGGLPTQTKTITATTSSRIVTPDSGYVLESVTVNPQTHSSTSTPITRTASYDLGANHSVRYINTNSVPNNNTQTKTITTRGSSIDLGGATHNYRYVDTTDVGYRETVLWTNPSPSSSFARQKITLPSNSYNFELIEVQYKYRNVSGYLLSHSYARNPGNQVSWTPICMYAYDDEQYIGSTDQFDDGLCIRKMEFHYADIYFSGVIGKSGLTEQTPSIYVVPLKIIGYY